MAKIDNSTNGDLIVAYNDPIKKIVFFCHRDQQLPAGRLVAAMKAKRFAEMKVDEETFFKIDAEIRNAFNVEKDYLKAFAFYQDLSFRLKLICEEKSILELVKLYYYLPDEDPNKVIPSVSKKKSQLFEEHPEVKGFFLRIGVNMMNNFGMKSDEEVLLYLEETKPIIERLSLRLGL